MASTFTSKDADWMKLNLLPADVSKRSLIGLAIGASALMAIASILAMIFMWTFSGQQVARAKERVDQLTPDYNNVLKRAEEADTIIAQVTDIDRNLQLANAMQAHNGKYTRLYNEIFGYLPSWFRLTSISAQAQAENVSTVTITGVVQTYQQYADMNLALLRIPDVQTVGRSGFSLQGARRPALNEADQLGTPIRPGESQLPSDPQARFDALIERANSAPSGFQNTGEFGTATPDAQRGAMPGWSAVTYVLTMARDLRVPNPTDTLRAGGAAPNAGSAAPGGAAPGMPTGAPPVGQMNTSPGVPGAGAGQAMPEDDR